MGGKKKKSIGYRQIFLIICTVFWVIYPFIARVVVNKVPEAEQEVFSTSNGYIIDLLLYCKELSLAGFVITALLYFIGERIFPDHPVKLDLERAKKLKIPFILIGGYALFSVLSFVFSDYKETAILGSNQEYEGLIAVLCYIGVFVFACFFMRRNTDGENLISGVQILRNGILFLSLLVGILSIIEVFWKPLLEFEFIQDLISSEKNREIAHSIKNENFIGQICLAFNNPGYLGGFCALFIPLNFSNIFGMRKIRRILGILGTGMMGLAVLWSSSNVALISLIISMPLLLFFIIRREKKNKKPDYKELIYNLLFTAGIVLILIVLSKILPTYSSRVRPEGVATVSVQEKYKLSKAELINGELFLYSGEKLLKVSVDKDILHDCYRKGDGFADSLIFSDGNEIITGREPATVKATNIREEKPGFKLKDERYSAITAATDDRMLILDLGYTGTVEFCITESGIKAFGQGSKLIEEIPQPLINGSESFYSFGTGRGYIWIQSLPVLKDSLLLGGGNGTFVFRFRQNEIVGLLNTHGSYKYVIDRPHNWYLQIACSDGVPALICVLALFICYIVSFFKKMRFCLFKEKGDAKEKTVNQKLTDMEIFDIGMFSGLIGFMICGLINDSCITVNPWFWMILGTAFAGL